MLLLMVFICGMVFWGVGTLKPGWSLSSTADLGATVVHSYKYLRNDVKPVIK